MKHGNLVRLANGIVSLVLIVVFLAHEVLAGLQGLGLLGAKTGWSTAVPAMPPAMPAWVLWAGVAAIVVHIALSVGTTYEMMTDKVRPPSERKVRHQVLKWVTGAVVGLVAIAHVLAGRPPGADPLGAGVFALLVCGLAAALAVHVCVGMKSLLKDLGIDRRWRMVGRVATCVVSAAAALLFAMGALGL